MAAAAIGAVQRRVPFVTTCTGQSPNFASHQTQHLDLLGPGPPISRVLLNFTSFRFPQPDALTPAAPTRLNDEKFSQESNQRIQGAQKLAAGRAAARSLRPPRLLRRGAGSRTHRHLRGRRSPDDFLEPRRPRPPAPDAHQHRPGRAAGGHGPAGSRWPARPTRDSPGARRGGAGRRVAPGRPPSSPTPPARGIPRPRCRRRGPVRGARAEERAARAVPEPFSAARSRAGDAACNRRPPGSASPGEEPGRHVMCLLIRVRGARGGGQGAGAPAERRGGVPNRAHLYPGERGGREVSAELMNFAHPQKRHFDSFFRNKFAAPSRARSPRRAPAPPRRPILPACRGASSPAPAKSDVSTAGLRPPRRAAPRSRTKGLAGASCNSGEIALFSTTPQPPPFSSAVGEKRRENKLLGGGRRGDEAGAACRLVVRLL